MPRADVGFASTTFSRMKVDSGRDTSINFGVYSDAVPSAGLSVQFFSMKCFSGRYGFFPLAKGAFLS